MSFTIQILCVDTIDSACCVILCTDNHRVLFDCGEGVQRLCVEHKIRLGKISAVLLTDFSVQRYLGIPGLSLTVADAGNSSIIIGGPVRLEQYMQTTQHFMRLPEQMLCFKQYNTGHVPIYEDKDMIIIPITFPLNATQENRTHCCYVGSTTPLKGKFDIKKAQELGVPKGPMFGILKNGTAIKLPNGLWVQPEDVLGESIPSKHFAIICCIEEYDNQLLEDVVSNAYLNSYRQDQAKQKIPHIECMIHLSPLGTIQSTVYRAWMHTFGSKTQHIFVGHPNISITSHYGSNNNDQDDSTAQSWLLSLSSHTSFQSSTIHCHKMNNACSQLFPKLEHNYYQHYCNSLDHLLTVNANNNDNGDIKHNNVDMEISDTSNFNIKFIYGVPQLKYHMLPLKKAGLEMPFPRSLEQEARDLWQAATADTTTNTSSISSNTDYAGSDNRNSGLDNSVIINNNDIVDNGSSMPSKSNNDGMMNQLIANVERSKVITASNYNREACDNDSCSNSVKHPLQSLYQYGENKLWFLGTGCAIPSKYRNVSGIWLQLHHNIHSSSCSSNSQSTAMLIDAGEGSWAQLMRMMLSQQQQQSSMEVLEKQEQKQQQQSSMEVLEKQEQKQLRHNCNLSASEAAAMNVAQQLKVVWISHPHADHHLGLIRIITERKKALLQYNNNNNNNNNNNDNRRSNHRNSNNNSDDVNIVDASGEANIRIEPLIVIAPPSVLAYLMDQIGGNRHNNSNSSGNVEKDMINSYLSQDAFIPVSCRQYDPYDTCQYTDVYWKGNNNSSSRSSQRDKNSSNTKVTERKINNANNNNCSIDSNNASNSNSNSNDASGRDDASDTANSGNNGSINNNEVMPNSNSNNIIPIVKEYTEERNKRIKTGHDVNKNISHIISTDNMNNEGSNNEKSSSIYNYSNKDTATENNHIHPIPPPSVLPAVASSSSSSSSSWKNYASVFRENVSDNIMQDALRCKHIADTVLRDTMGITKLVNVQVIHCGQSYGLCIEVDKPLPPPPQQQLQFHHTNIDSVNTIQSSSNQYDIMNTMTTADGAPSSDVIGFKLVYSGDTRPCDRLVTIGQDATILIHEATFEDDKQAEAINKRHSTIAEAIEVGQRMHAYRVILTHFSQRYPSGPNLHAATTTAACDAVLCDSNKNMAATTTTTAAAIPSFWLPPINIGKDSIYEINNLSNSNSSDPASLNSPSLLVESTEKDSVIAIPAPPVVVADLVTPPILAFDFMQLSFQDMIWAPSATALFAAVYPPHSTTTTSSNSLNIEDED